MQVRKFVCVGTLEERIDSMIEEKKALAERIVGTGESWLTELSTADLRDVLALSPEAVSGDRARAGPEGPGWWAEAGPPIQVEGGIKARSKRGAIGEQWWSRRFVEVLESFGMSGRLARGRNYARRGQVLEFELGHGVVRARVQGSRPVPYQVRIGVLPLTTAQWRRVIEALRGQALFRAKLLAGEMPHEIERVFADCGTPLFPRSARDLDLFCSCPDWGVPCKHLAAVCYVLAERFDDDPFGMLAWRGRDRADLLAALRRAGPGPDRGRRAAAGAGGRRGAGPGGGAAGAVPGPVLVARGEPGPAARRPGHPAGTARPAAALGRAARCADPRRRLADLLGPAYQRLASRDTQMGHD